MKRYLVAGLCLVLVACHTASDEFTYLDTGDSQVAFYSEKKSLNLIEYPNAHSGKFVYKLDSVNPYSGTFYMNVSRIFPEKPKKALLSAWVLSDKSNSNLNFILEVRDDHFNQKEWLSNNAMQKINKNNEWVYVEFEYDLLDNQRNAPENYLRAYLLNNSPNEIYVDDVEMRFY